MTQLVAFAYFHVTMVKSTLDFSGQIYFAQIFLLHFQKNSKCLVCKPDMKEIGYMAKVLRRW